MLSLRSTYCPNNRHDMRWAERNAGGVVDWNPTSPVVPAVTAMRMSMPAADPALLESTKIVMSRPTAP